MITSLTLSVNELWLVQRYLRHETQGQREWSSPPSSRDLNDKVARALLFCSEFKQEEASLEVAYDDLLALDYVVPQDAKDSSGQLLGKPLLLKTYAARARLADPSWSFTEGAEEPVNAPSAKEVTALLNGEQPG